MKFFKPQLMTWGGNKITDHNRAPLDISVERIENRQRTVSGTSRAYVIADKRSFSTSWTDVPATRAGTVDEFFGAKDMENFYNTAGVFSLVLVDGQSRSTTYQVYISSFSCVLNRRVGKHDLWNVTVEMTEV